MGAGANDLGLRRRHLRAALDSSLTRLGVEHIDLYQMHAWDAVTPLDETLRFLDDAVTAGKISYYGFSNYLGWQVTKAVHTAREHGWTPPVTLQPQYSLLVRDIEHEVVPACSKRIDCSLVAAGRRLADRQVPARHHPQRCVPARRGPGAWHGGLGPAQPGGPHLGRVDAVGESPTARLTSAQVALAWVGAQPAVTSVILGARNVEQLTDDLAAANLDLSAEQPDRLTKGSAPHADDYPYGPGASTAAP